MRLFVLLFSLLILIASCSPEDSKTPKVGVIAEDARLALDKAKTVQATVDQSADAARQALDEQTK